MAKLFRLDSITHQGRTYRPVYLRGKDFPRKSRTLKNIRRTAKKMGLENLPAKWERGLSPKFAKMFASSTKNALPAWWDVVIHDLGSKERFSLFCSCILDAQPDFTPTETHVWWATDRFVFLAPTDSIYSSAVKEKYIPTKEEKDSYENVKYHDEMRKKQQGHSVPSRWSVEDEVDAALSDPYSDEYAMLHTSQTWTREGLIRVARERRERDGK